jgi:hypothetical protein
MPGTVNEQFWNGPRTVLRFFLSPTRFVIDCLKQERPGLVPVWSLLFPAAALVIIPVFLLWKPHPLSWPLTWREWLIMLLLFCVPWSRVVEIPWAFLGEANQRLAGKRARIPLPVNKRLRNLLFSYFELVVDFAVLYFLLPDGSFRFGTVAFQQVRFHGFFQAIYFSAMTITTTGYGDIAPQRWASQFLCMTEPVAGLVLVALGIGSYIATIGSAPEGAGPPEMPYRLTSVNTFPASVELSKRIDELNNKCTQVLLFLTFAIAAAVLLWSNKPSSLLPSQLDLVLGAMKWWVGAIFPTLLGIIPLKEVRENDSRWYAVLRWMKFCALWAAIICIAWGAADFARAV